MTVISGQLAVELPDLTLAPTLNVPLVDAVRVVASPLKEERVTPVPTGFHVTTVPDGETLAVRSIEVFSVTI